MTAERIIRTSIDAMIVAVLVLLAVILITGWNVRTPAPTYSTGHEVTVTVTHVPVVHS